MELTAKGASANIPPNVASLNIFLSWQKPVDFDLLIIGQRSDGSHHAFYFGNKTGTGIQLGEDAGVGDSGDSNNEEATIDASFWDTYEKALVGIIDYPNVSAGQNGRFDTDTPTVMVMGMDAGGSQVVDHLARPDGGTLDGNAYAVAKLTRSGPVTRFEVVSEETLLKGFDGTAIENWARGILA